MLSRVSCRACRAARAARLLPEISSWTILEWGATGFSIGGFLFFCTLFSYTTYPSLFPSSFSWADFRDFIPIWWTQFEWWAQVVLGVTLIVLPRIVVKAVDRFKLAPGVWALGESPEPTEPPEPPARGESRTGAAAAAAAVVPPSPGALESHRRASFLAAKKSSVDLRDQVSIAISMRSPRPGDMSVPSEAAIERYKLSRSDTPQSKSSKGGFAFSVDDEASFTIWESQMRARRTGQSSSSVLRVASSAGGIVSQAASSAGGLVTHAASGAADLVAHAASSAAGLVTRSRHGSTAAPAAAPAVAPAVAPAHAVQQGGEDLRARVEARRGTPDAAHTSGGDEVELARPPGVKDTI